MKNILLIGCGHMGSALLTSWIVSKQYHITLIDPLKINVLNKKYKKIKILGNGDIKAQLNVEADFSSKTAKEKIEKSGGKLSIKKV